MNRWVLKIELNGEWEECEFKTQTDALAAFMAIAADYAVRLKRAVLVSTALVEELAGIANRFEAAKPKFLN